MPSKLDQIVRIQYFNCNYDNPKFFYHGFHRTDLAVEIEFKSGKFLHLGWSENDRPEIFKTLYNRTENFNHLDTFSIKDATSEWKKIIGTNIASIEIDYVSEERNIPSSCTINTEDGQLAIIVVSAPGKKEDLLPVRMEYAESAEFYIFINQEPPPIEKIYFSMPDWKIGKDEKGLIPALNLSNQKLIGILVVFVLLGLALSYYFFNRVP